jgi:hypothetical protein
MQETDQGLYNFNPNFIRVPTGNINLVPTDLRGLTFSRTPQQVGGWDKAGWGLSVVQPVQCGKHQLDLSAPGSLFQPHHRVGLSGHTSQWCSMLPYSYLPFLG